MKKLLTVMIFVLIAIVSCGGESKEDEYTEKYAKAMCDKIFNCEGTEMYQAMFGGTESNCVTLMTTDAEDDGTDDGTDDEEECESINWDKADQCIKCYEDLSCEDFVSEENPCPVCDETCNDE